MKACVLYKKFYWYIKEEGDSIIKILQIIDHEKLGMGEQIFSRVISIKDEQFLKQGQCMGSAFLYPHTQGLIADYVLLYKAQYFYCIEIYSSIAAIVESLEAVCKSFISFEKAICKNFFAIDTGLNKDLFAFTAKMFGTEIKSIINILNNEIKELALNDYAYVDVICLAKAVSIISQIRMFGSNIVFAGISQFMTKGLALEAVFRFYMGFNTQFIKDFMDLYYLLINTRFKSF